MNIRHRTRFAPKRNVPALLLAIISICLLLATPGQAAFPGANGRISFTTDRTGNSEVFTVNPDGSAPANLTGTPTADRDASWSPDGRRIAYVQEVAGNTDIYIKTLATGRVTRITTHLGVDASPAWSADGRRLAFVSNRAGNFDLYTVNAARESTSNSVRQLTNTAGTEGNPEWSPDGTKIAFDLGALTWNVYLINADGTAMRAVTTAAFGIGRSYFNPSWSPDGRQLAFDNDMDIFRIDANANGGLDCVNCTNLTGTSTAIEVDPAWSPDGRQLAFVTTRDRLPDGTGNREIYVMNATNGSAPRNLTNSPARDADPHWGRQP